VVTQLAAGKFKEAKRRVVVGYSMGAQMAILLSARNTHISHLITMVPPAVKNVLAVSPSEFAEKVTVPWLLILASEDQFSTAEDNQILIRKAPTSMEHKTFDSGHLLPSEYVIEVTNWIDKIEL
jgi:dienelactone hydrolase